ncbi:MAG: ABC transporter ATP-binding protein [Firmicutes bacterium]|nr:ABC transporter ATP-binding protein [Bacillota bacterium]
MVLAAPAEQAPWAIEVEGLVKRYGNVTAVNGISFAVRRGETFGLLGPNGAGKTTTLEIIEGLRRPDAGRVIVEGIDAVADPQAARSLMGVQLQEAGLFEKLTVAETIRLFSRLHRRRADVAAIIERLQLTEKANALVGTLSGGQRQRLCIALALVNDPKVVFLDEPTTGLDPQARRNLWDIIRSIREDGRTVVLTTHYMDEAEVLCDRVAIVDQGRLIAMDRPDRLIREHAPGVRIHLTPDLAQPPEAVAAAVRPLSGVNGAAVNDHGDVVVYSHAFEETVDGLMRLAREGAIRYRTMRVETANLEDVFLKLTGRRLRD